MQRLSALGFETIELARVPGQCRGWSLVDASPAIRRFIDPDRTMPGGDQDLDRPHTGGAGAHHRDLHRRMISIPSSASVLQARTRPLPFTSTQQS